MQGDRIILNFLSGKGNVGKSVTIANLALLASKQNRTVLVWDNNFENPIQHILFGVEPRVTLSELIFSGLDPEYGLTKVSNSLFLVGGYVNYLDFREDNNNFKDILFDNFKKIAFDNDFDIILVDNYSGFDTIILDFCKVSYINVIMINDDPIAVFDSYGLLKILYKSFKIENIGLLINNVIDLEDGIEFSNKFKDASQKFLGVEFPLLGIIPYDKELKSYVLYQDLESFLEKASEYKIAINNFAQKIIFPSLTKVD